MSVIGEPSSAKNTAWPNAGSPEWSALMAEAQTGNSTAYRTLLVELARWLEHFYLDRLPREAVDDGVAGALRLIHETRHTYDPKRPFDRWLTAIARHQFLKIESARRCRNAGRYARYVPSRDL
jgi:DNA-directed RNA polymerase specialized sigma24 family protein